MRKPGFGAHRERPHILFPGWVVWVNTILSQTPLLNLPIQKLLYIHHVDSIHLSIHPSIYPSIHPLIHQSINPSINHSIHPYKPTNNRDQPSAYLQSPGTLGMALLFCFFLLRPARKKKCAKGLDCKRLQSFPSRPAQRRSRRKGLFARFFDREKA